MLMFTSATDISIPCSMQPFSSLPCSARDGNVVYGGELITLRLLFMINYNMSSS